MAILQSQHKGQGHPQNLAVAHRRQSLGFALAQVDDQGDAGRRQRRGAQDAGAARLDQPEERRRRRGKQRPRLVPQIDPVIGDEARAECHQPQRERGLPRPRGAKDQHAAPGIERDRRRMDVGSGRRGHGSHRQADHEARAERFGAGVGVGRADVLGPDHAAMRLDDLLRDRETKAGMVAELPRRALRIEAPEDLGQRLLGDARAGILDHHQHPVLAPPCPDPDRVALLAEADRVGDQIDEDLRQAALEPGDEDRLLRQVGDEIDALLGSLLAEIFGQIADHLHQVEALLLLLHQLTVEPRGVGDVADQPVEAAHVLIDHLEQPGALILALDHLQRGHGRAQRGKRVLDLVRDIRGELLVRVDPVIKRRDHAAQRPREPADLVGPRRQVGNAHPAGLHLASVAVAADLGGAGQIGQRIGDRRGQHQAQPDRDDDRHHEHLQHLFALDPHELVDLAGGRGHRDHAHHPPVLIEPGGNREDRRAAAVAVRRHHRRAVAHPRHQLFHHRAGVDRLRHTRTAAAHQPRDPLPAPVQHVGDHCRALVDAKPRHPLLRRGADLVGIRKQVAAHVEDIDRRALGQLDPAHHVGDVDAVTRSKVHRRRDRHPRLEHVGDQLGLADDRALALEHQAVAERVEVEHPRHHHQHRKQVEGDDLARQRRAVERDQAAPGPTACEILVDHALGADPVLAKENLRSGSLSARHVRPLRPHLSGKRHSSL
ncbi:hypothetical protein SDC9_34798 [bioreactor metagenome]|uniref:Uncharacterized protein n=1 Tax=bioreactor metagenome TaxID=1076179 RepID=A0A644VBY9_9ZZZZ